MNEDLETLECLKNLKSRGVKYLCCKYGEGMTIVAYSIVGDIGKASDIVYNTFWRLWLEKKFTDVVPPLRPFLYEEVKKACKGKEG